MHPALKPLEFLVGKWVSVSAEGHFPTIQDFSYSEELTIEEIGQPVLNFKAISRMNERPMHLESGFFRIVPGTDEVSTLMAHNFGITVVEEGIVNGNTINLDSKEISRMATAKEPKVTQIRRTIKLVDGQLEISTDMATVNTPLTNHLKVIYKKC